MMCLALALHPICDVHTVAWTRASSPPSGSSYVSTISALLTSFYENLKKNELKFDTVNARYFLYRKELDIVSYRHMVLERISLLLRPDCM